MIKGLSKGDRVVAKVSDKGLTIQGVILDFWDTILGGTPLTRFTLSGSSAVHYEESFDSIEIVEKAKPEREIGRYVIRHRVTEFRPTMADTNMLVIWTGSRWVEDSPNGFPSEFIRDYIEEGTWIPHKIYAKEEA